MSKTTPDKSAESLDPEVGAMDLITKAFTDLTDHSGRDRVLAWARSKFGSADQNERRIAKPSEEKAEDHDNKERSDALEDIFEFENDELRIIAKDIKAKSANDAAVRLAHLAIYGYERFTGKKTISARKVLLPILRDWRAYDGNTRNALANHRGIKRDPTKHDLMSLDFHSKQEAEKMIQDIRNSELQGTWSPASGSKKKKETGKANGKAKRIE